MNASAVSGEPFADEMIAFFFAIAVEMDRTDVRYIYMNPINKTTQSVGVSCKLKDFWGRNSLCDVKQRRQLDEGSFVMCIE